MVVVSGLGSVADLRPKRRQKKNLGRKGIGVKEGRRATVASKRIFGDG